MITLTKVLLACDPLFLFLALTGVGAAGCLVLLGVSAVVDAARKRTCPRCRRWAQIEGDDTWI